MHHIAVIIATANVLSQLFKIKYGLMFLSQAIVTGTLHSERQVTFVIQMH